jgi:tetratricopeptide (TPR) repeat protein
MSTQQQRQSPRDIFLACVKCGTPRERAEIIVRECRGDDALQAAVVSLLEAHDGNASFLENPIEGLLGGRDVREPAPTVAFHAAEQPGSKIGPYKLLQQIGEGGFGVVYMAQQTKPVRRKVALKIIKAGMDTREVIARFEAERQALALMDHPNIAKVLDAGTTGASVEPSGRREQAETRRADASTLASGRPYFVMELVHGVPITEFCDDNRLTTRERLELFVAVCRAVQHAHQKGIIHRDLKPSNVMVTMRDDRPAPKVIDFGISKALSQQLTEKTLFTAYGQMIGTPLYMSPEQAQLNEIDVDTRSDVYSLGVLLYELLTGSTPFDKETLQKSGFEEMRRMIREVDPPRPSARISTLNAELLSTVSGKRHIDPRKLSASLRGELDWIVMKALEKDRNRRYESASAFAADVERYLADEPVQACPPSLAYRLRKLARRHKSRVAVGSAILVALCLVAGVLLTVRSESRAREQEAVRGVADSLASAQTAIDTNNLGLADQKLTEARARLELGGRRAADLRLKAKTLQEAVDDARRDAATYARFVTDIGDAQDRMFNSLPGEREGQARVELRKALDYFGIVSQPDWIKKLQRMRLTTAQKTHLRETAYETLLLLADESVRWEGQRSQRTARAGLKYLDLASRFHERTKAYYWARQQIHEFLKDTASATADRKQYEATPPRTAWDWFLPGHSAAWGGDRKTAIRSYEAALRIQPDHFNSLYFLALRLGTEKRHAEALGYWSACIALRPKHSEARLSRGTSYKNLGNSEAAESDYRAAATIEPVAPAAYAYLGDMLRKQGKSDEAIALYRKAIALQPKYAFAHMQLGQALRQQGKLDEAIAHFRRGVAIDPKNAVYHNNLGHALYDQGSLSEAIARYQRSIALNPKNASAHNNLGFALGRQGKPDEAIALYRKAIALDPKNSSAHNNLGVALGRQRKPDEAIALYRKAIALNPKNAIAHINLGAAFEKQGNVDEAIALYRKAVALDPKNAIAHKNLGDALAKQGKLDEAIALYRKAIALNPKNAIAHNNLGCALEKQGKLDEAIACYRREITLDPTHPAAHFNLGLALESSGKLDDASACLRKAIALDPKNFAGHYVLGRALDNQGHLDEAIASYRNAIAIMRRKRPKDPNDLGGALASLALTLLKQKDFPAADAAARESLEICKKTIPDDWRRFNAEHLLGAALLGMGQLDKAEPLLLSGYRGMKQREAKIPATSKHHLADAARRLVELYERKNDPAQAAAWRKKLPVRARRPPVVAPRPG